MYTESVHLVPVMADQGTDKSQTLFSFSNVMRLRKNKCHCFKSELMKSHLSTLALCESVTPEQRAS